MTMKDLWERFVEQSPVTVMARVVLEQAISAEWVDSVFEKHRQRQYTRELLFSTVVELRSRAQINEIVGNFGAPGDGFAV